MRTNDAAGRRFSLLLRGGAALAAVAGLSYGGAALASDPPPATPAPTTQPPVAPAQATHAQPGVAPAVVGPEIKREPPPLVADPGTIDLKFMEPETSKSGKTSLKNTGTEPLKILRVQPSCSCTVATDLTNKILAPGESVDLEATLKGGKFAGPQNRKIQIFVDGYGPAVQVFVVGEVALGVKSAPTWVDCFQVRTGLITFESTDDQPFNIISVNCEPAPFVEFDPKTDKPRKKYTLKYDFQGRDDPTLPRWFLVETDHPKAPVVDLRVINPALVPQMDPKAPWNFMEDRALVGLLHPGESKELNVGLRPVSPPAPDAEKPVCKVENPAITVEAGSLENGPEGWVLKVKVTAKEPLAGCTLLNERMSVTWLGHEAKYDLFGRIVPAGEKAPMK